MFEPIETGREGQWFHTNELDTEPPPTQYNSELDAIEAAVSQLAKHVWDADRSTTQTHSIDWQLYERSVIHEEVESARGMTTSTTVTPLKQGTTVRLTLIPPG